MDPWNCKKENRSSSYIIFIPELNTTWHGHLNQILEFTRLNNELPIPKSKRVTLSENSENLGEENDVISVADDENDVNRVIDNSYDENDVIRISDDK